jgi:hypothetical protein
MGPPGVGAALIGELTGPGDAVRGVGSAKV